MPIQTCVLTEPNELAEVSGTYHIHIRGQVQGVGFRPFVFLLAQKLGINGWVNNTADGVHIEFNATEAISEKMYAEVTASAPQLSVIGSHRMERVKSVTYDGFKILDSRKDSAVTVPASPDFAICESCSQDLADKANRRYRYAFTTCTQCGPRYSIMEQLPYDRVYTSMKLFAMCSRCRAEYDDPSDRRQFSQTNSCPDCPVQLGLYDSQGNVVEEDQTKIIAAVTGLWHEGKIVAVKGVGGYQLTCDATNPIAVRELRLRKHRPAKPFAVMFPDIDALQKVVRLNDYERFALQGTAAPIVLLALPQDLFTELAITEIAPRLSSLGAMLPGNPLYQLLLQQFAKPIIATSGNLSNAPIVSKNADAMEMLTTIADYIVSHNREILTPQDDSILVYTKSAQQRIVLRRARGLPVFHSFAESSLVETTSLAMGALLKSSITLQQRQNIHVSQYLGNTNSYDGQLAYQKTLAHLMHLFRAIPGVVLVDSHPGYFSTALGAQLAGKWASKLVAVQHHKAHFASVLGEHRLLNEKSPILGVIWDGAGYGDDGEIWGGEFLLYYQHIFSRVDHFEYFNHLLGDKMANEPRLAAFALCHSMEGALPVLQEKFTVHEWHNYKNIIATGSLKTSSVGRLFDAVASLLGLVDKASYEGEAAMLLEQEAYRYFGNDLNVPMEWITELTLNAPLSARMLAHQIVTRINRGMDKAEIAAWFHVQLVLIIRQVASKYRPGKICFSGGVFQNNVLVDLVIKLVGDGYRLYFNNQLSPNDENISYGQLVYYSATEKSPGTERN